MKIVTKNTNSLHAQPENHYKKSTIPQKIEHSLNKKTKGKYNVPQRNNLFDKSMTINNHIVSGTSNCQSLKARSSVIYSNLKLPDESNLNSMRSFISNLNQIIKTSSRPIIYPNIFKPESFTNKKFQHRLSHNPLMNKTEIKKNIPAKNVSSYNPMTLLNGINGSALTDRIVNSPHAKVNKTKVQLNQPYTMENTPYNEKMKCNKQKILKMDLLKFKVQRKSKLDLVVSKKIIGRNMSRAVTTSDIRVDDMLENDLKIMKRELSIYEDKNMFLFPLLETKTTFNTIHFSIPEILSCSVCVCILA